MICAEDQVDANAEAGQSVGAAFEVYATSKTPETETALATLATVSTNRLAMLVSESPPVGQALPLPAGPVFPVWELGGESEEVLIQQGWDRAHPKVGREGAFQINGIWFRGTVSRVLVEPDGGLAPFYHTVGLLYLITVLCHD
jgi:hypothetical protein